VGRPHGPLGAGHRDRCTEYAKSMKETRAEIIGTYARWTALSALRSGSPVKSRADVYRLVAQVPFDAVLVPTDHPIATL
jgi:hypothetical protein